jgi:RNA polymerase sigma-70 factor (ECF subfamily)
MESIDEAAVAEARRGNPDGFRVLVERHSRAVYRLTYRMTGNEHDAEDLVQETFLRAAKQIHRFDGRAAFGTWLHRIAANCATDLLRARTSRERRMVKTTKDEDGGQDVMANIAAATPSPERLALSTEILRLLTPAMAQLTEMERAVFVLRHYDGRSIEEICEVMKVKPGAAKNSIFRAVQKLRRVLEPALGRAARTAV